MYVNSLGMGGGNAQAVQSSNGTKGGVSPYCYDAAMKKALEKRNAAVNTASAEGDMSNTQPSNHQKTTGHTEVTEQAKREMTMQEYRQWFRGEAAQIQAEAGNRSPYLSDTLIIREEAFEKMKSDPGWEKEALDKIREHCTGKEAVGTKQIGYQIIGSSPENCHEEGIPVKTNAAYLPSSYSSANEISSYMISPYMISPYAALTYASPYAGSLYTGQMYAGNPWSVQNGYWKQMLSTGQAGLLNGQSGLAALASSAYGSVLNGGAGSSLLGNFMI